MLNRVSCIGSLTSLSSVKLKNHLDERVLGLAALVVVSAIEIGVRPVASVTSADEHRCPG
jgi:hypothetical protein